MRTQVTETVLYSFDELSDTAKQSAIESLYDLNVDHDWWDYVYNDAEEVGCEINGFDLDRGAYCDLTCNDTEHTAHMIISDHGDTCDTHKTAVDYLTRRESIINQHDNDHEYELDQELDGCGIDFTQSLSEDYRIMLQRELDYLTSKEAIIETINCNEYEFTVDGKLF